MSKIGFKPVLIAAATFVVLGVFLKIVGSSQNLPKPEGTPNPPPGSVYGEGIGLPKSLPADLVFYPGSTLISSNSDGYNSQVAFLVEENLEKIKDFYSANLLSAKWKFIGNNRYFRDGQELELNFTRDQENHSVTIINHSLVPTK